MKEYFNEYLRKHVYINSGTITKDYMHACGDKSTHYQKPDRLLQNAFNRLIHKTKEENKLTKFSKTTYRVIKNDGNESI